MSESVSVAEAKRHFSELLRRVGDGEEFVVTSHGRPVAQIGPPRVPGAARRRAAIERILELRKGNRLDGLTIREMIDEDRR